MPEEEAEGTGSSENPKPSAVDAILEELVQPLGIWQIIILLLCTLSDPPLLVFPVFGDSRPAKFHCKLESRIQEMLLPNSTQKSWCSIFQPKGPLGLDGNFYSVPFDEVASAIGPWVNETSAPGCYSYGRDYLKVTNLAEFLGNAQPGPVEKCPNGYIYEVDKNQYPSGVVIEWDLVCDKAAYASYSTNAYTWGMMPGMIIGGMIADVYGRRSTANLFWALQVIVGVACSFTTDFVAFIILRCLLGATTTARANSLLVLPSELTTGRWRFIVSAFLSIFQCTVIRWIAIVAAMNIPYWRWLHLAFISPIALGILHFWYIPESPRWLNSKNRHREAAEVLYKGYLINKRGWRFWHTEETPTVQFDEFFEKFAILQEVDVNEQSTEVEKSTNCCMSFLKRIIQPFRTRSLCKIGLIAIILFVAQGACLTGLTLYARIVKDSVYNTAFYNSLTGAAGTVISALIYFYSKKRRLPLLIILAGATASLLFGGFYAVYSKPDNDLLLAICSNIAYMLYTAITNMILTYIPELYPSSIRSQGLGNASGLGRLGAAMADYLNQYDYVVSHGFPLIIYGGISLVTLVATIFLPDTSGENLPDVFPEKRKFELVEVGVADEEDNDGAVDEELNPNEE